MNPKNVAIYVPTDYALGTRALPNGETHLELGFLIRGEWIGVLLHPAAATDIAVAMQSALLDLAAATPDDSATS
jgi:hypothetical protein